ncbi:MAG: LemA family protein [Rhodoferax sp.]
MVSSFVLWIAAGVLLFWCVGAHNRLVRLRSATRQAFGLLDARLLVQLALLQSCLPASMNASLLTQPGELLDETALLWVSLRSAAAQFAASLAAARAHPLDARAVAALVAASGVLDATWQRMQLAAQDDPAGVLLPVAVQSQWEQATLHARAAGDTFNLAVTRYNAAIAQFPTLLLARAFGFKAARPL